MAIPGTLAPQRSLKLWSTYIHFCLVVQKTSVNARKRDSAGMIQRLHTDGRQRRCTSKFELEARCQKITCTRTYSIVYCTVTCTDQMRMLERLCMTIYGLCHSKTSHSAHVHVTTIIILNDIQCLLVIEIMIDGEFCSLYFAKDQSLWSLPELIMNVVEFSTTSICAMASSAYFGLRQPD